MCADMSRILVAKFVFKNCVVKYFNDGGRIISRIKAQPQKDDVFLDRNFEPLDDDQIFSKENDFYTFLGLAIDNYSVSQATEAAIGYLLLQNRSCFPPHAFILCPDEYNLNGWGIGKSLLAEGIAKMCKPYKKHAGELVIGEYDDVDFFRNYTPHNNLLIIEDVPACFNYAYLFNYITGAWIIRQTMKEAYCVNAVVPRMLLCAQKHPGHQTSSFNCRFVVLPMSDYFGGERNTRPLDVFGHVLFDSWNEKQWSLFDNFMFYCIEQYIKNGEDLFINLRTRYD